MPVVPIYQDLVPQDIPLKSIYLDPNNPRFVGTNWKHIQDGDIDLGVCPTKCTPHSHPGLWR